MTFLFRIAIALVVILFTQVVGACAPQRLEPSGTPAAQVMLPGSELRQLKSTATGHSYDIYIRLPDDYLREPWKKYPVLYVLDGQWDFKLLDSIYGGLFYDGSVPEMIIVGITYSGDHPDYGALRAMDYTPVTDPFINGSGDASKFHMFLKGQLLPFIEANYRADPSRRVLMGSSFGGTFSLYAMFSEPTLFDGYVIGSPIVTYGHRYAFQQESEYAGSHEDLPVRLFLSVGELEEMAQPVNQFMQILRDRNYPGLALETRIIAGERHASNKPEAYNRGLRYIFQDK